MLQWGYAGAARVERERRDLADGPHEPGPFPLKNTDHRREHTADIRAALAAGVWQQGPAERPGVERAGHAARA